jgi:hypothetical protein
MQRGNVFSFKEVVPREVTLADGLLVNAIALAKQEFR